MTELAVPALARAARDARRALALSSGATRDAFLHRLAAELDTRRDAILAANAEDVARARAGGMGEALLDRLTLTPARLAGIAADVRQVATLPDPLGERYDARTLDRIALEKRRVPLGVIGVIYEARPNVTVDCAALCIKSGNAAVLRGSADTLASNRALLDAVHTALAVVGLPTDAVGLIDSPDRAEVEAMLGLNELIDLIIPRGGAALHQRCRQQSRIPVITGGIGICHLYASATVDLERALPLIDNAKTQRPSVCNALDTVLADRRVATALLPAVVERLAAKGVSFRADPDALALVGSHPAVQPAGPEDFDTEWLGLTLGLKVVDGVNEAIAHIQQHSTGHSDGILSADPAEVAAFLHAIDSAAVYVNASTRFTDGSQFGLGAEIAVSTQRIHARGPMALEALTSYQWVVHGDYAVRP